MNSIISKFSILTITLLLIVAPLFADETVSFTANAPKTVAVGESFQLAYTLNTSGKDLRLPELKGFDVIAGPFKSTSSSVQYINGSMTSSKTVRYTYTLLAQEKGSFQISPASVIVKSDKHFSNSLSIKVIEAESQNTQQQQGAQNQATQTVQPTSNLSKENLFIRAIPTKTKVMEQEAIMITYKIYARVDLVDIQSVKFPELKGLLVQEIDQNAISPDRETYNGKNYITYVVRKYLVFPQYSGEVVIKPFTCDAIVRVTNRSRQGGFFDAFFDSYQDVKKPLASNSIKLNVESLPTPKPANFSGAVGTFDMTANVSTNQLKTHESLVYTIKISGNGNSKLIKTPVIKLPTDFEVYDPKVKNDFRNTARGLSGSKTIEYLAIPRHDGNYTIPTYSFSYFDIDSKSYKTLTTKSFELNVLKGEGSDENVVVGSTASVVNQENVKILASDIKHINTNFAPLKKQEQSFAGTLAFWLAYIISTFITIVLILIFRKKVKENANLSLKRNKNANKVARKRLKIANKELQNANKSAFYEEILKALWGYLCDKFTIPISQLNKENVEQELTKRNVPQEKIEMFLKLLNDCEFEQYAPSNNETEVMDKIYNSTMNVISELENTIKK